jgi:hypothetical protein
MLAFDLLQCLPYCVKACPVLETSIAGVTCRPRVGCLSGSVVVVDESHCTFFDRRGQELEVGVRNTAGRDPSVHLAVTTTVPNPAACEELAAQITASLGHADKTRLERDEHRN